MMFSGSDHTIVLKLITNYATSAGFLQAFRFILRLWIKRSDLKSLSAEAPPHTLIEKKCHFCHTDVLINMGESKCLSEGDVTYFTAVIRPCDSCSDMRAKWEAGTCHCYLSS